MLKDKLKELVQICSIEKKGERKYEYLVLERDTSHFVKENKRARHPTS
jgi:hypothetical protein